VSLDIVVRPYRLPDDVEALVRIYDEGEQYHRTIEPEPQIIPYEISMARRRFESMRLDPQRALLVAEVDGAVVGFVEATMRREELSGFVGAWVDELNVATAWWGRGIGTRLLAEVERWALGNGAMSIALDTMETNARARRLYEHLGFRTRAVVMSKRLAR
jgi:GNAT superfamily N-acetyltransferase